MQILFYWSINLLIRLQDLFLYREKVNRKVRKGRKEIAIPIAIGTQRFFVHFALPLCPQPALPEGDIKKYEATKFTKNHKVHKVSYCIAPGFS
jgi:hypothetical protein